MLKLGLQKSDFPIKGPSKVTLGACCCCCCFFWIGGVLGAGLAAVYSGEKWKQGKIQDQNKAAITVSRKGYWITMVLTLGLTLLVVMESNTFIFIYALAFPVSNIFFAVLVSSISISMYTTDKALKFLVLKRNIAIFFSALAGWGLGWGLLAAAAYWS